VQLNNAIFAGVRKIIVVIICISAFCRQANGQASVRDSSISMLLVAPGFAIQLPLGDLSDRFGSNSNVSLDVSYKHKSNWVFGIQGAFIFGSKVEQTDLFSHLITSQGQIIGSDGKYADIRVFERGYSVIASVGKLFSFKKPNPNSGLLVSVGAGYLQHKIRIEDKLNIVPSLQDDYVKGYDHLTGGPCARQAVSYIYLSSHRLINFFLTAEVIEGFTKGLRTFDFDLEAPGNDSRVDILAGLRVGWILPLYRKAPEKYYMY
jgi:hypothetical protein